MKQEHYIVGYVNDNNIEKHSAKPKRMYYKTGTNFL